MPKSLKEIVEKLKKKGLKPCTNSEIKRLARNAKETSGLVDRKIMAEICKQEEIGFDMWRLILSKGRKPANLEKRNAIGAWLLKNVEVK